LGEAVLELADRERHAYQTRLADENLLGRSPDASGHELAHALRRQSPGPTRLSVGVSARTDDGGRAALRGFKMRAAHKNRRRLGLVAREHGGCGHCDAVVGANEREVRRT
jgi:hypothetical protein